MTQRPSWRHHYIPEFYLRRWMPGGTKPLTVFWRPAGSPKIVAQRVYPKATGYIDRRIVEGGADPALFQIAESEFYTPADNAAATVLAKMETGAREFSGDERSAWTRFILSLIFRTPEAFQITLATLREDVLNTSPEMERSYRRSREPGMPATLREAMKASLEDGSIAANVVKVLVDVNNSDKIGTHLVRMAWGTIQSGPFVPALLTSDRPVLIYRPLSAPDAHILVPVGPKRIFVAAQTDELWRRIAARSAHQTVQSLNEEVVSRAVKYVFGFSDWNHRYISEKMSTQPQATVIERVHAQRQARLRVGQRRIRQ
jgi:hypothetical protein